MRFRRLAFSTLMCKDPFIYQGEQVSRTISLISRKRIFSLLTIFAFEMLISSMNSIFIKQYAFAFRLVFTCGLVSPVYL